MRFNFKVLSSEAKQVLIINALDYTVPFPTSYTITLLLFAIEAVKMVSFGGLIIFAHCISIWGRDILHTPFYIPLSYRHTQ